MPIYNFTITEVSPNPAHADGDIVCTADGFVLAEGDKSFESESAIIENGEEQYNLQDTRLNKYGEVLTELPRNTKAGNYSIKVTFKSNQGNVYTLSTSSEIITVSAEGPAENVPVLRSLTPSNIEVGQARYRWIQVRGEFLDNATDYNFRRMSGEGAPFLRVVESEVSSESCSLKIITSASLIKAGVYRLYAEDKDTKASIRCNIGLTIKDE